MCTVKLEKGNSMSWERGVIQCKIESEKREFCGMESGKVALTVLNIPVYLGILKQNLLNKFQ
jgi:hypothetical protein